MDIQVVPKEYLVNKVTGEIGAARGICFPSNLEEVVACVKNEPTQPLITIGSFTGLTGATFPSGNETFLSLKKMNRILELDEETMTLTVEAGVTLTELQNFLAATPYFYAPDPGEKAASIGGTAATNAGGMRAIKYGVTRDNIRGLEVVLASGEVMDVGGLNRKSSSGYDLKDLFIGSEGTLGIITKLQLKLVARPSFEQSLLIGFKNLDDLAPTVFQILSSTLQPTTLEFFERQGIQFAESLLQQTFPNVEGAAFLLVTLDGDSIESIENQQLALQNLLPTAKIHFLNEAEAVNVWYLRGGIVSGVEAVTQQEPLDIVVPVNQITGTIQFMKELASHYHLNGVFFGHAGDGNIHVCVMREQLSDEEWQVALHGYLDEMYQYIASVKGLPSAEHGIGLLKKEFFLKNTDPVTLATMEAIKKALDPHLRLNPGKIFSIE
jgi:glycolate oxidase